jgi:hypothetical protein
MSERSRVPPELAQALRMVETALHSLAHSPTQEIPSIGAICRQGHLSIHAGALTTTGLPREHGWIWNQSRGRKSIGSFQGDKQISYIKLNTRSRATTAPLVKLWVFTVEIMPLQRTYSILWCEKSDYLPPSIAFLGSRHAPEAAPAAVQPLLPQLPQQPAIYYQPPHLPVEEEVQYEICWDVDPPIYKIS